MTHVVIGKNSRKTRGSPKRQKALESVPSDGLPAGLGAELHRRRLRNQNKVEAVFIQKTAA